MNFQQQNSSMAFPWVSLANLCHPGFGYPSAMHFPLGPNQYSSQGYVSFCKEAGKGNYVKKELTEQDIIGLLSNYEEAKIQDIPLTSRVRYFSPEKRNRKMTLNEHGKPIITFKRGGFLKHVKNDDMGNPVYCVLTNKAPWSLTHEGTVFNWCVTVDKFTVFYKIKKKKKDTRADISTSNSSNTLKPSHPANVMPHINKANKATKVKSKSYQRERYEDLDNDDTISISMSSIRSYK